MNLISVSLILFALSILSIMLKQSGNSSVKKIFLELLIINYNIQLEFKNKI